MRAYSWCGGWDLNPPTMEISPNSPFFCACAQVQMVDALIKQKYRQHTTAMPKMSRSMDSDWSYARSAKTNSRKFKGKG